MKGISLFIIIQVVAWGIIVGGYSLKRWFDPRKRAQRAIERMPATQIAELADGTWARVTGRVAPLHALQPSPVDQRSCIAFRLVVETAIRGDPSNGFRQVLTRESCPAFSISDETGTAIIDGPFLIGLDVDDSSWTDLPAALFRLLDDAGVSPNLTNLGFSEAFLLPGDLVTVVGAVSIEIHPAGERGGLRDPPMRRRISGRDGRPVLLRDAVEILAKDS